MAEPVFSYEGDIAPQKGSYFSEIPRSRYGVTYSTPDTRRYAAGVLGPMYRANREAEEAELKRRDDELVFQRNRLLVQDAKEQTRMRRESLEFINNPEISNQLSAIEQKISGDPDQARKELSDWTMKNISGVESSSVMKDTISQLRARIDVAQTDAQQKDYDQLNRVKTLASAGELDRAAQEAAKIKNPSVLANANIELEVQRAASESTKARANLSAEEKQKTDNQAAEQKKYTAIFSDLKGMTPAPVDNSQRGLNDADAAKLKLGGLQKARVKGYAKKFGIDPNLEDEELYMSVWDKVISLGIDESAYGGDDGEVTGRMTP